MSSRLLTEIAVDLVVNHIKSTIGTALAGVSALRADNVVPLPTPDQYFIYSRPNAFECPAVFVVADAFRTMKSRGANHVNGQHSIKVGIVVENRNREELLRQSWRYMSALHEILDQEVLENAALTVKIVCLVSEASYSPEFTSADDDSIPQAVFRKEVVLDLTVEHFESF